MKYTAFTGCSYTEGRGLDAVSNDPNLWVNILHQKIFNDTSLVNLGRSGANNEQIFQNSVQALLDYDCKYLVVQWTELLRYQLNPGVETYPTGIFIGTNSKTFDITVNPDITYKSAYIDNIKNRFIDMQHPHYAIVKVLEYSKIIKQLCDRLGVNVFFINGILPWDSEYFTHIQEANRLPSQTTEYTQTQLNLSSRSDQEYFVLYDKIHQDYLCLGDSYNHWINLYSGYRKYFYLDQGNDNLHPGILSNQAFAQFLIEKLHRKLDI